MKKFYPFFLVLLLSCFFRPAHAQVLNFSFQGSNGDESSWPSSAQQAGVEPSTISRGPGVTATANADRFNSKNWTTASSPDMNDYIEFTITPAPGFSISLSNIVLQHQRSSTGPKSFVIRTSLDGFAADATNEVTIADVNTNQTSSFNFPSMIITSAPITIRIYAYNAELANGTWGPGESADGNDMAVYGITTTLPVRFVNVKAQREGNRIQVSWTNATEADIQNYVVERSADGRNFTSQAQVNPSRNNGASADYTSFDLQPLSGVNFYRIRAVETDGHILYSRIVKLAPYGSDAVFSLYPNPAAAGSQLMIQTSDLSAGSYTIKIYNASAQLLLQQQLTTNGGPVTQSLQLGNWQKGFYVLEITGASKMQKQFIVQ
jgi:hypothetical protein